MIHSTIEYINLKIDSLGIFTELKEITTQVRRDDKVYPGVYSGGDLEEVNFDFSKSNLYHRIIGEIEIEQNEDDAIGGDGMVTETYPLRLVAYFPKNLYQTDDGYIELKIASNIRAVLNDLNISSFVDIGAYTVEVSISSVDTDAFSVWNKEFTNIDFRVPTEYGLIALDYSVTINGADCLTVFGCNDEDIDVEALLADRICAPVTIYNLDGTVNSVLTSGDSFTLPEIHDIMVKSYQSDAAAIQVSGQPLQRKFEDFIGFSLTSLCFFVQGAGLMGHLSTLSTNKKLITAWDSTTGIATFRNQPPADNQITLIAAT